ncbi:MAG: SMP-30/gluconolactonase/LRE family protein [Desulfobacteraceae bacterium]|nr:SMP-30/gluconolactonase/LRE family protein [Desulfobacteraceae bacterium]
MLKTKWFKLSAYVAVGLMMVATVIAPKVVVGETEQQLPPKFIVGDIAQSILDVKTKGDHIGDTTKTVALNVSGYDDVVLHEHLGLAYLTGRDGWMWKVDLKTGDAEHFVDVPLMPAGAHQFPGDENVIIITCSRRGGGTYPKDEHPGVYKLNVATKKVTPLLLRVPKTEKVSVQTVYGPTVKRFKLSEMDNTNSRQIALANDASISADGKRIYFSESYVQDGATMGGIKSLYQMIMLGTTGRLWMLDTENQTVSLIANGFTFTDGVLVEESKIGPEKTVLLADNAKLQIHRIHLSGSKAGKGEIIWKDLPGLVDGFHRDAEGRIWVSIIQVRTPQLVYIHANPEVKPMMMKHPQLLTPLDNTAILVLSSDASKPLWYTEHPQTHVTSIPSAITGKDGVYLANFSAKTPGLHRMDNPFAKK